MIGQGRQLDRRQELVLGITVADEEVGIVDGVRLGWHWRETESQMVAIGSAPNTQNHQPKLGFGTVRLGNQKARQPISGRDRNGTAVDSIIV